MTRESEAGDGGAGPGASRRDIIRAAARRPARAMRLAGPMRVGAIQPPVFISYARPDYEIARDLVEHLRERGVAVTWDQDLSGGIDFERTIRKVIDDAPTVLVVWSAAAAASAFVRDEARRALAAAKLVTTHVDGFDFADVPLGFGHLHAVPVEDRDRVARSLADHGVAVGERPGSARI